ASKEPPTPERCTLSLHDALPIYRREERRVEPVQHPTMAREQAAAVLDAEIALDRRLEEVADGRGHGDHGSEHERFADRQEVLVRSEEHTSELQSRSDLVCRLLLE